MADRGLPFGTFTGGHGTAGGRPVRRRPGGPGEGVPAMMVLAVNDDQVTPGVTAFLIVAALGVTLFFLIRSMNKRIARIEAPHEEDLRQDEWERRQAATATTEPAKKAGKKAEEKVEASAEADQREA